MKTRDTQNKPHEYQTPELEVLTPPNPESALYQTPHIILNPAATKPPTPKFLYYTGLQPWSYDFHMR
jgi:hypothetical protein